MRIRPSQLVKPLAAALAAGLLGASAFAQLLPPGPQSPDTQPAVPPRPRVELRQLHSLTEGRDLDNAPHERWEKAAYLGVATSPAQPAMRQQLRLPRGVGLVVDFIEPKSPADEAGLHQYDVIEKLDDQILINPQQLAVLVRIRQPGDSIKLTAIRDGKPLPIDVKLVEREVPPLEELRLGNAEPAGPPVLGENDWPALPNFPLRRIGQSALALPQSDGALHVVWNDGSADLTLTGQGTRRFLVFRDKAGQILFRGPIDTAEQRDAIPKDLRDRLQLLPEPFKLPPRPAGEPASRPADSEKSPATKPATRKIDSPDQLRITFSDLTGPGTTTVKETHPDKDGNIRLPYLEGSPLHAVGVAPVELESLIVKAYSDANIIQRVQVSVEIIKQ